MTDDQAEIWKANAMRDFAHAVRLAKNILQDDLLKLKSQMTPEQVETQKTMIDVDVSDLMVMISDLLKEQKP